MILKWIEITEKLLTEKLEDLVHKMRTYARARPPPPPLYNLVLKGQTPPPPIAAYVLCTRSPSSLTAFKILND